jgi:CRISPR/Cas system-associated exonuclease Cas4 (RecB family)
MIAPASTPGSNGTAKPADEKSTDPLEYVSASRLKNFLSCRLRFYFEKVLNLPRPLAPKLHLGRAVHAGLQHYNKARWRGGDASEPAVLAAFNTAFTHPEDDAKIAWDEPDEESEARAKGEEVLIAFLARQQTLIEPLPMGVEVSVHAELPSLALPLLGVIDLVKADRTTVDYKTVGTTPNVEQEAWQHEIQLTAYALLIEDATGEASPGSELVFLVKTKAPKVIVHRSPTPTQLQRDRFARLVEIYANAVTNERYHPSPGMQCSWCSFRQECSRWKGGVL